MNRRGFLAAGGALGVAGASATPASAEPGFAYLPAVFTGAPLAAPKGRRIKVAFAINPGVQGIDLVGPWDVFEETALKAGESSVSAGPPFETYTVSESLDTLHGAGNLLVAPHFTVATAPQPDVLVVPHFYLPTFQDPQKISVIHEWIKAASADTVLTMSVCTGAFQLAKTGLLDGLPATTNRKFYDRFQAAFPKVKVQRGPRFVETGRLATAGGITAGIDLGLRVVERFFGRTVAERTADSLEYVGQGWRGAATEA
jgi:transcriptional regulator GlxA family with amidase domain